MKNGAAVDKDEPPVQKKALEPYIPSLSLVEA